MKIAQKLRNSMKIQLNFFIKFGKRLGGNYAEQENYKNRH